MNKLCVISSFYTVETLMPAIHKVGPQKLIIFINEDKDPVVRDNVEKLKALLGNLIDIHVVRANVFDTVSLAGKVVKLVEAEKKTGNRVVINVTGGRRIQAFGILFGAYARAELVERIIYGTENDSQLYDLPKMGFNLGETKLKILKELSSTKKSVSEVAKAVKITPAMAYVHIRELKASGYVDNDYRVTSAGELALL